MAVTTPHQYVEHPRHESRDGGGAADHDAPFVFGRLPSAQAPFPFSTRELARLMVLRSRVREARALAAAVLDAQAEAVETGTA